MTMAQRSPYQRLRQRFVRAPFAAPADLGGKHVIVTGASPNSIGYATARILASWGATVVVTTRSDAESTAQAIRAELPAGSDAIVGHDLDLCQTASVDRFVAWYRQTQGERLDVLINNAGIHLDLRSQWKEPRLSNDGHEIQWRTNYLGTMQLTQRLLPLLAQTGQQFGDARVVNVVSMLHSKGRNSTLFAPLTPYNSWWAYGNSKLALVHATGEIQRRYADANVQAYCLHPGAVRTNIADKGLAGSRLIAAVRKVLAPVEAFFMLTPEEGAQTQIHCATAPALAGGLYFRDCKPAKTSDEVADTQVSERLWEATQGWVEQLG